MVVLGVKLEMRSCRQIAANCGRRKDRLMTSVFGIVNFERFESRFDASTETYINCSACDDACIR
jgi:hypothetical protein